MPTGLGNRLSHRTDLGLLLLPPGVSRLGPVRGVAFGLVTVLGESC